MDTRGYGLIAALLALTTGCSDLFGGPDGGSSLDVACDADAGALTLTELHPQIMGVICHDCHKPDATVPDMSTLDVTFTNVVDKPSLRYGGQGLKIVDPGNLANSVMWIKVSGGSPRYYGPHGEGVGAQMPAGRPALEVEKKELIRRWICSGAAK